MTKFSLLGVLSCVAGALLVVFQFLSSIMGKETNWKSLAISNLVNEKYLAWVDQIPFSWLERFIETIIQAPLFIILFCLGGLFFVMEYFLGKK